MDRTNNNNKKQENHKEILLAEFRRKLQDILQPHHDDQFLGKWLIARDFDLNKAEKMIRESFITRKKIGVNSVLTDFEVPEVYKHYRITDFLGIDKANNAVRVFMLGIWDVKGHLHSMEFVDFVRICAQALEYDLKQMEDRKKAGQKTDMKTTFVIDFTNFSIKNYYDKNVLKKAIQLLNLFQDNYPEIINTAYCVNAPSYISFFLNIFKPFMSASTLSKIRVFHTDEYQEELRNLLDPKLIPGFLGGELTSPDGDPKCSHMFDWNSKVDPCWYRTDKMEMEDPSMKTVTVQQRGILKIPVEVHTSPAVLKWVFVTKEYNIRFGLFLRTAEGKSSRLEELIPLEDVDCHIIKEENEFICRKTGTYILHFDNSYSWLTAKQISYKVELENLHPNDIIN